jgi:hypothetical protein
VVRIVSPNGRERVRRGDVLAISWDASDDTGIASQTIEVYRNGTEPYSLVVADNLSGDTRSYDWTVPDDTPLGGLYLRVTAVDASGRGGSDTSDRKFKVRRAN